MSNPEVDFGLSERGRLFAARLADNPLDLFQGKTLGWLEDFIRITVGDMSLGGGSGGAHTVGHMAWIGKDLTGQTGEYVYEDDSGQYLYLNGAAVSQTIYADLYEFYGPNAYGTDSGGLFLLPDTRGRTPFLCGTHSNADLGDNDGISLSLRQALHQHSVTGTVASHTHSDGTLVVASHTHSDGSLAVASHTHGVGSLVTGNQSADHTHSGQTATNNESFSMAPGSGLLDYWGGATGSGIWAANGAGSGFEFNSAGATGGPNTGHTHNITTGNQSANHNHTISGSTAADAPDVTGSTGSESPDVTGSTGSEAPSLTGTAGSGMALDAPAHIFIGSLLVRF